MRADADRAPEARPSGSLRCAIHRARGSREILVGQNSPTPVSPNVRDHRAPGAGGLRIGLIPARSRLRARAGRVRDPAPIRRLPKEEYVTPVRRRRLTPAPEIQPNEFAVSIGGPAASNVALAPGAVDRGEDVTAWKVASPRAGAIPGSG